MKLPKGLPKNAVRIWQYIKENVPKPKKLAQTSTNKIRFFKDHYPFPCCPMGLCSFSKTATPIGRHSFRFPKGFKPWYSVHIVAYYVWWENLTDSDKAIKLQWGN